MNSNGTPETVASDPAITAVVVDDDAALRQSCASVLEMDGFDVTTVDRGPEALDLLRRRRFDIALLDLYMGKVSGLELLAACLETAPDTLGIIMTGNPSVRSSIEALRAGAWDYLPKPFSATHLRILMGRAAHVVRARRDAAPVPPMAADAPVARGLDLIGNSPAFRNVVALAQRVAGTDASVFISGESGTGKEQVAQFIHANSRRSGRELVALNCAALPEGLLESEMFGHVQGAFTGAVRDKPGLLEVASGGTIFLDEITEMPVPMQAKLLRVIQDGVVRRVGSNGTDAVVDVRFISATNRDVQGGSAEWLRSDLFYRLCVVPIRIPPLRERVADIPLLATYFLERYWRQHRQPLKPPVLGRDAIQALCGRPWRGNVRELQNVIEHAVVLLDPGAEVRPEDLPDLTAPLDRADEPDRLSLRLDPVGDESYHGARERVLSRFESGYLRWLVDHCQGNMSKAARMAGVDRTTLYRLMDKHGLQRSAIMVIR